MTARYTIVDPRPIAAEAPYTYYLPSPAELAAVRAGDLVKVPIRAVPPSEQYDAERMWVLVTVADDAWLEGTLDSTPADMPLLPHGSVIRLARDHVIDILFADPERAPAEPPRREYWDRCLVDLAVLDGDLPVGYLYRETPDMDREGDKFPDSGWRLRGDCRDATSEDLEARKIVYVALGAVLNRDDSWLPLLNEPVGARFEKDFATGRFERED